MQSALHFSGDAGLGDAREPHWAQVRGQNQSFGGVRIITIRRRHRIETLCAVEALFSTHVSRLPVTKWGYWYEESIRGAYWAA